MRRFEKITFTCTITEARNISKALHFFAIACTKATAENLDGIKEPDLKNMKLFGISTEEVNRLTELKVWLKAEADDLDAENDSRD